MITTTLQAIYSMEIEVDSRHVLYIVRDGETVLYVGQSQQDVVRRIRSHSYDALKRSIDAHRPSSLEWAVDLCTIEDCQAMLGGQVEQATVKDYEWLLIRHLAPTLNVVAVSASWPHESETSLRRRSQFAQAVRSQFAHLLQEVVYVLEDPRDSTVRYVGRTARSVAKRLLEHMNAEYMRNVDLAAWLAELKALGLLPILRVIDSAPEKLQAIEREQLWIRWYIYIGEPLLNRPVGPTGQWKHSHRPPLCLPEKSEQKLLEIAQATGEHPIAIMERLLDAELKASS